MLEKIKKDYRDITDLVIKEFNGATLVFIEPLVDQNKINDYILKILTKKYPHKNIKNILPSPNIKDIKDYKQLILLLNYGFTIVINGEQIIAVETKADLSRSIDTPDKELALYGPKDAFVENYQTNIGLIKRRIKSTCLKNKDYFIGRYTKNKTSLLYINDIVNDDLVKRFDKLLKKIDVDGVNDISSLKQYLTNERKNTFPNVIITERPDAVAIALTEGKIAIIMDTSPYALILPAFLSDFINPITDNYAKTININFIKILRFFSFFVSILAPAIYVAITTINQETIPTSLLLSFQDQRFDVPFSAPVECLLSLLICELLKESDERFPQSYGSAISILGGLVLGEAAVAAGFVSPIMIIVVALTFISSLIFTDQDIINGIRYWRFFLIILAPIFGLYGVVIGVIMLIVNIGNYNKDYPYLFPITPFDKNYIAETIFKFKSIKRSKLLSKNRYKEKL